MRKLLVLIGVGVVVLGGAYLWFFKKGAVKELVDSAAGYPFANSPKEAGDLFRKAMQNRNYKQAAKYVTKPYAEELTRAAEAGEELGKIIDDITARMKQSAVMNDEVKEVIYWLDPFYKEFTITIANESEKEATAEIKFDAVKFEGQKRPYENWAVDTKIFRALSVDFPIAGRQSPKFKVLKEGEHWKLDFPVSKKQQEATIYLRDKYMDYVNPLKKLSIEIKVDASTKEDVRKRMKELLEEAARN